MAVSVQIVRFHSMLVVVSCESQELDRGLRGFELEKKLSSSKVRINGRLKLPTIDRTSFDDLYIL
jgi:hypothetical protein